jgi:hypothetical protein
MSTPSSQDKAVSFVKVAAWVIFIVVALGIGYQVLAGTWEGIRDNERSAVCDFAAERYPELCPSFWEGRYVMPALLLLTVGILIGLWIWHQRKQDT